MKRNVLPSVLLAVGLFGGGLLSSVEAAPIELSNLLIPGAYLTQGDKRFDNFSTNEDYDPSFPAFIEGVTTLDGQHGFVITTAINTPANQTDTGSLDFRVTVLDPGLNLHSATSALSFSGTGGSNSITVKSEFFADAGHTLSLGNLSTVWSSNLTASSILKQDTHQLFARLNLTEVGPVLGNQFTIQTTFTQAPAVPEPTSLILLGSGLIGLAVWRWKHTA